MSATTDLDQPLVVEFPPIEGAAGSVSSITITEPTAAQIALWDGLENTPAQIKAISVCSSTPTAVIEKLPARAFMKAVKRVEAFLA